MEFRTLVIYFVILLVFLLFIWLVPAFRSAVDWNERWIQGILAFHLALWLFFIVTRKSFGAQVRDTTRPVYFSCFTDVAV